jgi:hypothetical protein
MFTVAMCECLLSRCVNVYCRDVVNVYCRDVVNVYCRLYLIFFMIDLPPIHLEKIEILFLHYP